MAKLTDVLGALLRDIAESRVQSDLFSRQAGLEYLNDPVLRNFPVPRAEIRSVDLDFRFAVAAVQRGQAPAAAVLESTIRSRIPELNAALLQVPFKSQRQQPPASARPLAEILASRRGELERLWTESFLESARGASAAGSAEPAGLPTQLAERALKAVREVAEAGGATVFVGAEQQKLFQDQTESWIKRLRPELERAAASAKQGPLELEALITRDELAELPEHALSQIKLTVAIENYEWHESEDEKGELRRQLLLR